jgi:hypothetical protein
MRASKSVGSCTHRLHGILCQIDILALQLSLLLLMRSTALGGDRWVLQETNATNVSSCCSLCGTSMTVVNAGSLGRGMRVAGVGVL